MKDLLQAAGLHDSLARCYLGLLDYEFVTPAKLANEIKESRTNTYKLLDELVELGLAKRNDISKKLHYKATSPTHLQTMARENKDKVIIQEKQLSNAIPNLLKKYYQNNEQPNITFYQGKAGIKEIFDDQINIGKPIQFMKTREDMNFFGFDFMHHIRNLAPKAGIHRKAFTPDAGETPVNVKESDIQMLLERTWYEPKDYTAPVEWSVYGDKVSIISFGEEAIGTVIESPQIAESLRQIFKLLDEGLKRRPNYGKLPMQADFTDAESFIAKHKNKAPDLPH